MAPTLVATKLFVPPARICAVKNILEGYDNLAVVTTVDVATGEILVRHQSGEDVEIVRIVTEVCGAVR